MMVRDPDQPHISMTPRTWYRELWDTINGAGAWDANPWIVAVTFRPEPRNIDSLHQAPRPADSPQRPTRNRQQGAK
jgi:hypothetical protein